MEIPVVIRKDTKAVAVPQLCIKNTGDLKFYLSRSYEKGYYLHSHDFIELVIVLKGSGLHFYHQNYYKITAGDIFYVLPQQQHGYFLSDDMEIISLCFYPESISQGVKTGCPVRGLDMIYKNPDLKADDLKEVFAKQYCASISPGPEKYQLLKQLLINLHQFYENPEVINARLYNHLGEAALLVADSIYSDFFKEHHDFQGKNSSQMAIAEAVTKIIIEEYQNSALSVNEIAERTGYSEPYLCRVFKDNTGISILEYLNLYRILQATEIIPETEFRVIDIAQEVGFNDASYFTRLFKRYIHAPPGHYKKRKNNPWPVWGEWGDLSAEEKNKIRAKSSVYQKLSPDNRVDY